MKTKLSDLLKRKYYRFISKHKNNIKRFFLLIVTGLCFYFLLKYVYFIYSLNKTIFNNILLFTVIIIFFVVLVYIKSFFKKDEREKYLFTKKHLSDLINVIIALIFIMVLYIFIKYESSFKENNLVIESFYELLNNNTFGVFISIILVVICNYSSNFISLKIIKNKEDAVKQTEDYDKLCKKYCRENLLEYTDTNNKDNKLPIILLSDRKINGKEYNIRIVEKTDGKKIEYYHLPKQVKMHSEELLKSANIFSIKYNNTNIRINDLTFKGDDVDLTYSFTHYYDSIITNKTMDFPLEDGRTIREIYEPGPFLNRLEDSKLSNHLGFNGFVELEDDKKERYIIFVKRDGDILTAKKKWQQSIGASLKAKYCLDNNRKLTSKGISEAIKKEIEDELFIKLDDKDYSRNIFAFYRDLVEGGKPQFLFYIKADNIKLEQFEENFTNKIKEKGKNAAMVDGIYFNCIKMDDIKEATFTNHSMIIKNNEYEMTPSSIASIILFLKNI